jgi:hypothetical protein
MVILSGMDAKIIHHSNMVAVQILRDLHAMEID